MADFYPRGIDCSKWQGAIDWSKIVADGFAFTFIKATEGSERAGTTDAQAIADYGEDPDFRANWAGAKAAGLVRGAYHFARPDLGGNPEWEADWFLSVVRPEPGDLLAIDFEPTPAGQWGAWLGAFVDRIVLHAGFAPLFYTYQSGFAKYGIDFNWARRKCGLWISAPSFATPFDPGIVIDGWPFIAIHQLQARPEPGVSSSTVDYDLFNGTLADLRRYGMPEPAPPVPTPIPPPPQPPAPPGPLPPAPVPPPLPAPIPEPPVPTPPIPPAPAPGPPVIAPDVWSQLASELQDLIVKVLEHFGLIAH